MDFQRLKSGLLVQELELNALNRLDCKPKFGAAPVEVVPVIELDYRCGNEVPCIIDEPSVISSGRREDSPFQYEFGIFAKYRNR